jgi:hypothetical protein
MSSTMFEADSHGPLFPDVEVQLTGNDGNSVRHGGVGVPPRHVSTHHHHQRDRERGGGR